MNESPSNEQETRRRLDELMSRYPELRHRLGRALLIALHAKGVVTFEQVQREARGEDQAPPGTSQQQSSPASRRWRTEERDRITDLTFEHAAATLSPDELDDIVNLTRKREEAQSLEEIANLSSVSFGVLRDRVKFFCAIPRGQTTLPQSESESVRVALIRSFVSGQLEFIGVAKRFLRIRDFDGFLERVLGSEGGTGVVGGKAAGLLLAHQILSRAREEDPEAPQEELQAAESWYIRSDVIEDFLRHNGLQHLQNHKYLSLDEIRRQYPLIVELFRNADFPETIVSQVRGLLEEVGHHPLIVRSSSLLEDRFGTAFAGKYRSVFVGNQGTEEERLDELLGAIAEVYASTLHPDPIGYRRRHQLLDFGENMAVLIQKLVGRRHGRFFLPTWAGVAFSRNLYRRSPRIRAEDGMARIVFGLGTRAVDRVGSDFPRMIPLGLPSLRPEVKTEDVVRVSQRDVDVIDLETNQLRTVPIAEVIEEGGAIPGAGEVFSALSHGSLRPILGSGFATDPTSLVANFDGFTNSSGWPRLIRWCLSHLEAAYGSPVDIEFASDGERFTLLQCRPQAMGPVRPASRPDAPVSAENVLFTSTREVLSGKARDIEWIVLIDPRDYHLLRSEPERAKVARMVAALNDALAGQRFLLMGPGRWGSQDSRLGVRVGWSDICHASVLVEVARRQGGYVPEISFGSHFFQDLVESEIQYLALYPDDPGEVYSEAFFDRATNRVGELVPDAAGEDTAVRLIHVPSEADQRLLHLDMDGDEQRAIAYFASPSP